ncbi:MAG TPA: ABC transporter ATP-binding protein [Acidimicrobiales bacterium]|nr:ABC transporter ATP-binding protein [Acidimicrobiales bacterium]
MGSARRAWGLAVATAFRADPWRATGVLVLSTAASLAGVLGAFWLRYLVDAAVTGDEVAAFTGAAGIAVSAALALLARAAVTRMQFPLKEKTGLYLDRRIVAMVAGITTVEHHERPGYLDRLDVLRREMPALGFAGMQAAGAVALVVQVLATGFLLVSVDPVLLAIPVFALPSLWAGPRAERIRSEALDRAGEPARRARHLFELATSPQAAKELRVFGAGDELLHRHQEDWAAADRLVDGAARRALAWTASGWLLFSLGYAGAIALVVTKAVNGHASPGDVVLALALVAQVNAEVSAAATTMTTFARILEVARRYLWLEDYARARTPRASLAPPDRLAGGIELRGITFRYEGTDVDVLSDVDLVLPAGATVAIVGANGAGKSTLVKLLCRFYEPSAGSITVDGTDLSSIDAAEWRRRMSAGFQDFTRLELRAGQTVGVGDLPFVDDAAAIAAALERAASTDLVAALPSGLATQLGASYDGGVELSGGQWQKLALARAMMRPAPLLLVLDEPTAALDAETEHRLFGRFAAANSAMAARNGAITLLVSHRFSTVRGADRIVVLDGGRVTASGTHDQLMAAGGLYAELYELQGRAYR